MSRRATAVILGVFLLFVVFTVYQSLDLGRFSCRVCVEYQGRTACRSASAPTREEAIRTATDNACAQLTSGMSEIMACTQAPPVSIECEGD